MHEHTPKNTYYALRHGRSEKNDLGLVVSYPEAKPYHLTEMGRAQVAEGAEWLKDKAIDLIIASEFGATKKTNLAIITVCWGHNTRQSLIKLKPNMIVNSPKEILYLLEKTK